MAGDSVSQSARTSCARNSVSDTGSCAASAALQVYLTSQVYPEVLPSVSTVVSDASRSDPAKTVYLPPSRWVGSVYHPAGLIYGQDRSQLAPTYDTSHTLQTMDTAAAQQQPILGGQADAAGASPLQTQVVPPYPLTAAQTLSSGDGGDGPTPAGPVMSGKSANLPRLGACSKACGPPPPGLEDPPTTNADSVARRNDSALTGQIGTDFASVVAATHTASKAVTPGDPHADEILMKSKLTLLDEDSLYQLLVQDQHQKKSYVWSLLLQHDQMQMSAIPRS